MSPVYEYGCIGCDHEWYEAREIEERNNLSVCDQCKSPGKLQISVVGFKPFKARILPKFPPAGGQNTIINDRGEYNKLKKDIGAIDR